MHLAELVMYLMQGETSLDKQEVVIQMMRQLTSKLSAVICKLLVAVSASKCTAGDVEKSPPGGADARTFTLPAPPYWTAQLRDWFDEVGPETLLRAH